MWVEICEFKSTKPHRYFLKIIWDSKKLGVVSEIVLYQVVLYQGCCVPINWENINFHTMKHIMILQNLGLYLISMLRGWLIIRQIFLNLGSTSSRVNVTKFYIQVNLNKETLSFMTASGWRIRSKTYA